MLIKSIRRDITARKSKGVTIISTERREYKKLDMNKLNCRITEFISTEEALKDVIPIEWSDDVLSGKKKVTVTAAEKDYENKCVKLEMTYS
jgi:hypothetical protein